MGLISATSAFFTSHEKRIKIAKGEPAGGQRSEVGDQSSPTGPIKRRAERQARSRSGVELASSRKKPAVRQGLSTVEGSRGHRSAAEPRSAASLPCRAELRDVGEGRREVASQHRMVRGDRASERSEQTQRNGRARKKSINSLKEQRPVRSSEASSDRLEPPGRMRGLGPTKSRGANCRVEGTTRVAPASHHEGGR